MSTTHPDTVARWNERAALRAAAEKRVARREGRLAAKRAEFFAACSSANAEPMTPAEIVALLRAV